MTVTQEVTVCTECAEVTPILVNPFVVFKKPFAQIPRIIAKKR